MRGCCGSWRSASRVWESNERGSSTCGTRKVERSTARTVERAPTIERPASRRDVDCRKTPACTLHALYHTRISERPLPPSRMCALGEGGSTDPQGRSCAGCTCCRESTLTPATARRPHRTGQPSREPPFVEYCRISTDFLICFCFFLVFFIYFVFFFCFFL